LLVIQSFYLGAVCLDVDLSNLYVPAPE